MRKTNGNVDMKKSKRQGNRAHRKDRKNEMPVYSDTFKRI